MLVGVRTRDDAEYLAPAALGSFVVGTTIGRLAAAVYLVAAGLLGLGLHALDASEAAVLAALTFLGISVPPVMTALAESATQPRSSAAGPAPGADVGIPDAGGPDRYVRSVSVSSVSSSRRTSAATSSSMRPSSRARRNTSRSASSMARRSRR